MRNIKVGIIGGGFIAGAHIEAIRRLGFVEVVALADHKIEEAKRTANKYNIKKAYGEWKQLLEDDEVEVIHNCTPNHLHFTINMEAIKLGKHVLSEKPLTLTSEESKLLVEEVKKKSVVFGVNFNYRQYPLVQQMRQMVKNGDFGDINLVRGAYLQDWMLYDTDYNWRVEPEFGGKLRAIGDIGSHWCDIAQYVLGSRIIEVFADIATIKPIRKKFTLTDMTFQNSKDGEFEEKVVLTEDYATVLLKFENGVRGFFTVSQVTAGRKNYLHIEMDGDKASCLWHQEDPSKLWVGHREKANEILSCDPSLLTNDAKTFAHYPGGHIEGWADGIKNTMLNFYTFISERNTNVEIIPKFTTVEEGHGIMTLMDAIFESSKSETWIKVNY